MEAFSSDEVAALRISLAALFLLPLLPKHYKKLEFKQHWKGLVFMGVFGNLIPAFLFTRAETQISSSLTGMLNALTPLFTVLIGLFVFKSGLSKFQLTGLLIGLAGTYLLLAFGNASDQSKDWRYAFMVVAATICYAISVNGIKYYLQNINSVTATVWSLSMIGFPALLYLLFSTDFITHLKTHPKGWSSLGFTAILGIFGTALSVIVYNDLIKRSGTVFATSCTYLIPVVAIVWGFLYGETTTLIQLLSIALIIFGVWLLNKQKT